LSYRITIIILAISLVFFSCASTKNHDPIHKMRESADKKINNRITRAKYNNLLDNYVDMLDSYNSDILFIYNKYEMLLESYDNNDAEFEAILDESVVMRKDIYNSSLDIEEEIRTLLSPGEWKKIKHRSLIILSEYYLTGEIKQ
jgi:hypothetical protein